MNKLRVLFNSFCDLKFLFQNRICIDSLTPWFIFASSVEDNFAEEDRPDKWQDLSKVTKKQRESKGKWLGQILQVSRQLASSVNTYYDNDSAVIGSNL